MQEARSSEVFLDSIRLSVCLRYQLSIQQRPISFYTFKIEQLIQFQMQTLF